LEVGFGPLAAVRLADEMCVAALDLDNERGTWADVVNLIASTPSTPNLGLAHTLAAFAGYNVVKIVILPATPLYVDAAAVLEHVSETRPI